MSEHLSILKQSPLFLGIEEDDKDDCLRILSVEKRSYERNAYVLESGDHADALGVLLIGSLHIVNEDYWGNRNIITEVVPPEVFAESFVFRRHTKLGVSVVANEASVVVFVNVSRLISAEHPKPAQRQILQNLLSIMAEKNYRMNVKLGHLSQRSTRERLLSYLSTEARRQGCASFDIPFDRQQLADYLSVDRSAMSAMLSKLRDEGILLFHKSHFELL